MWNDIIADIVVSINKHNTLRTVHATTDVTCLQAVAPQITLLRCKTIPEHCQFTNLEMLHVAFLKNDGIYSLAATNSKLRDVTIIDIEETQTISILVNRCQHITHLNTKALFARYNFSTFVIFSHIAKLQHLRIAEMGNPVDICLLRAFVAEARSNDIEVMDFSLPSQKSNSAPFKDVFKKLDEFPGNKKNNGQRFPNLRRIIAPDIIISENDRKALLKRRPGLEVTFAPPGTLIRTEITRPLFEAHRE
jgi:hypothetical protein